jgi:hypothetical protein
MQTKPKKKTIDDEVEHVLAYLATANAGSKEYKVAVENLKELCEARSKKPARLIELEPVIAAATGIFQILLIMNHERLHVIATKALGYVVKGRI